MREWTIHAGAAVCGIAIAGAMCLVEIDRYGDAMNAAERNTRNAARLASAHVAQAFADVRSSLQGVLSIREDVAAGRIDNRASVEYLLNSVRGDTDLIHSVGWTDEKGIQRGRSSLASGRAARTVDMSFREHFKYFRDRAVAAADEPVHVSVPFRTRRTGEWVLIASLPIREAGAFAGVAGAAIDPVYFARIYEGIDLGRSVVATLYRTDGTVLSRLPDLDMWAGKTGAPGGLAFAGGTAGVGSGTVRRAETDTMPARIVSYEAVPGLPLIVAFSVTVDEALAPFFDRVKVTLAAVALALAFLAGCAWFAHLWIRLRRRADETLALSENRYRTLSELSPVGVFRTDAGGRCIYTNERWRSFTGLSHDEASGDGWVQALHPDDRETAYAQWSLATRRDGHFANEYRFRDPAGRVTWMFGQTSAEKDADGNITGYVGTVTDITDLKHQEAALRESEERFRTLVNTVDGVVWESNPAGLDVTFVSHKAVDLLGYRATEWLEPGFRAARMHDEDRDRAVAVYEEHVAAPAPFDVEYRLVARDGRIVWVHDYVSVTADDGRPVRLRGILVDVSHQKTAEEGLRRAQKMEAVGQLTGGIAHDFNNLLAVVMGNAELLAELPMSETDREFLRSIEVAAERGANLTGQLLAFGRRSPLTPVELDLNEVVRDLDRLMRRTLPETIQIMHVLATDLWPTTADRAQLDNALLNLAINARDAMTDGGRITIRTENVWRDPPAPGLDANGESPADDGIPGGAYVAVSLTDTGSGMTPDVVAQAFEPYFTTKGPGEGSGLGLSMVYGFARQSGGIATIDSADGAGTTVTLHLPRAEEAAGTAVDDGEAGAATGGPPRAQPGERILVLEDDAAVRTTLLNQLRALGYETVAAHSGEAALAALRASPDIALLLTDVTLPGRLSGIQTAAAARRVNTALEVVFISGYPRGTSFDDMPADDVLLTKPVALGELARALRTALDRAERRSGRMAC